MSEIKLTESQLQDIICESVYKILNEQEMEEGWIGDKWNQAKSAFNTASHVQNGMSMKDKFSAVKKNWDTQGELNNLNNLIKLLSQFVDSGQLNPQMTIAQLIGDKYNNGKFGRMSAMTANRKAQIARRGGIAY